MIFNGREFRAQDLQCDLMLIELNGEIVFQLFGVSHSFIGRNHAIVIAVNPREHTSRNGNTGRQVDLETHLGWFHRHERCLQILIEPVRETARRQHCQRQQQPCVL